MQEITVTPLEALAQLKAVASLIDTAECKDEAMYNELQGALVVAQTALAMAPKQEDVKYSLTTQTGASTIKENLIVPFSEAISALNHVRTVAPMSYGRDPRDVLCAFINLIAAPVAANGALTDEQIDAIWESLPGLKIVAGRPIDHWNHLLRHEFARQVLAAAGPNAALPDFCFEDDADFMHRLGLLMNTKWPEMRKDGLARKISELANAHIRAALSGAKGN